MRVRPRQAYERLSLRRTPSLMRLQDAFSSMNDNSRFKNSGPEQDAELARKNRPAEVVALGFFTLASPKKLQFFPRFDPLGNYSQLQARPMLITAVTMVVSSGAEVI